MAITALVLFQDKALFITTLGGNLEFQNPLSPQKSFNTLFNGCIWTKLDLQKQCCRGLGLSQLHVNGPPLVWVLDCGPPKDTYVEKQENLRIKSEGRGFESRGDFSQEIPVEDNLMFANMLVLFGRL